MRLVQVAEMRLVQVAEVRLVQVTVNRQSDFFFLDISLVVSNIAM